MLGHKKALSELCIEVHCPQAGRLATADCLMKLGQPGGQNDHLLSDKQAGASVSIIVDNDKIRIINETKDWNEQS